MIWRFGAFRGFVGLSVSWVVMQGAAVAESSETPIGEVAKTAVEACDERTEMYVLGGKRSREGRALQDTLVGEGKILHSRFGRSRRWERWWSPGGQTAVNRSNRSFYL